MHNPKAHYNFEHISSLSRRRLSELLMALQWDSLQICGGANKTFNVDDIAEFSRENYWS
jgi:hypothetical protein